MNILLVDDDTQIQEIIEGEVSERFPGNIFYHAGNGEQALGLAYNISFSAIILDYKMPIMNGGEFVIQLRKSTCTNSNVPIILCSGFILEAQVSAEEFNNVMFLEKPINFDKLAKFLKFIAHTEDAKVG